MARVHQGFGRFTETISVQMIGQRIFTGVRPVRTMLTKFVMETIGGLVVRTTNTKMSWMELYDVREWWSAVTAR